MEKGGDWDRRNRFKVYRGLHLISIRQFKRGGELLLDALSTFTATELLSYNDFVTYTIISNVLTLTRVDLKKKVRLSAFALLTQTNGPRSSSNPLTSHKSYPSCPSSRT